jgi:methylated-DNA-[protein]-cysteine S-methyltransferase
MVSHDLDRRFRDAAASAGLLDVAYDFAETPIGEVLVAATPRGLCRISYFGEDAVVARLAVQYGPRVLRSPKPVDPVRRQLDEYFEGRRTEFDLELDLDVPDFYRQVLGELARVPFGETTTYGTLARRVNHPTAARAVGTVMNRNPIPIVLPCHRVIGANGSLVGYAGGLDVKRRLLALEGALPLQLET